MTETDLNQLLDTWQAPWPSPSLRTSLLSCFPTRKHRAIFGVPVRWLALAATGLVGVGLATSIFREPVISRHWDRLPDGTYTRETRFVEPGLALLKWFTLGSGSGPGGRPRCEGCVSRVSYYWDHSSETYSGYEWSLEPLGSGQYRISVEPLTRRLSDLTPFPIGRYRLAQLPPLPSPKIIREGVPFEIDVIAVPEKGERIYDRIELSSTEFEDLPARCTAVSDEEKRFRSLELQIAQPRLYVNGRPATSSGTWAAGDTVWVYLPERGRFLIALGQAGNPRFTQAGRVDGRQIDFGVDGDDFRIVSTAPVAGGGNRPIFVFHQAEFRLNPNHRRAHSPMFGSAGGPAFHR